MKNENLTAEKVEKIGTIVYDELSEGVRFIVLRGPVAFCAYVGVPLGHPLAGFGYEDLNISAHGGLTFSSEGGKALPTGYWWYGWDYAHFGDYTYFTNTTVHGHGHNWTIKEVVADSQSTIEDFKKVAQLAEKIVNEKNN